jgi:dimethylglycine dehydrogenase
MYDIFDAMGAVWGQQYGLEVPNYFAPKGEPRYETPSFRRSNAFEATAREVRAVREGVGINEVQNFGKYRVTGPRARDWLDRIMAGRIPQQGRLALTPDARALGAHHRRFHRNLPLRDRVPADRELRRAGLPHALVRQPHGGGRAGRERLRPRTGFQIAGPRARSLARVTRADVGPEAFRFLDAGA